MYQTAPPLRCGPRLLDFTTPRVMGILNLTPDSFYAGSRLDASAVVARAAQMHADGADLLDLGGYSTRPGAAEVSVREELDRVVPAVAAVREALPDALLSVDTFRAEVARAAVAAGADLVNDVSGGGDPAMFEAVADLGVPYVLMHARGTPQTMRRLTDYEDLLLTLIDFFEEKVYILTQLGVRDVIVDPGFGFAKTAAQGFDLLRHLSQLKLLSLPLLVGVSRKSMVYRTLGVRPEAALNGTTVLHTVALLHGANVLRVHDVLEAKQAVQLVKQMMP